MCVFKTKENHSLGVDNQPNGHNKKIRLGWSNTKLLLLVFSALCIFKHLTQMFISFRIFSYAKTLSGNQMSYYILLKSH